jgi:transposase
MASIKILTLVVFFVFLANSQTPDPEVIDDLRHSVVTQEQRAWIKIECIMGTRPAEIARRLNSGLGARALSESYVMDLCRQFTLEGRLESNELQRCGRPVTATGDSMTELVITTIIDLDGASTAEICDRVNISPGSVRTILHNLGYQYKKSRWIPHVLTDSLRQNASIQPQKTYIR